MITHIQTFRRFEDKFLLTDGQYKQLMEKTAPYMRLDSYCRNGSYKICNVYFDTPDNDVIRRSVSKPYFKEKLRLRSYGTPYSDEETVFLELKCKAGGVVSKRRAALTYGQAKAYLQRGEKPENANYVTNQVLMETDRFLMYDKVVPAAVVSYDRVAMFHIEDNDFRITFDTNLRVRRENVSLEKGCGGKLLLPKGIKLMEIKISGAIPLEFAHLLSELEIFSQSFSKIGEEYKQTLRENKRTEGSALIKIS